MGSDIGPTWPEDDGYCRKPKKSMYWSIAKQASLSDCIDILVVGDSLRDLQAAQDVHAKPHLVRTGKGERTIKKGEGLEGIPVYNDLLDFVNQLLESSIV